MQPVTSPDLQDAQRNKCIQECSPLIPSLELSHDHSAHDDWYKDGLKIQSLTNVEVQTNSPDRALVIPSAETSHGTYQCLTSEDTVTFKEDATGDLYTLSLFIIQCPSFFVWLIQVGSVLNLVHRVTIWVACRQLL